MSNVDIPDAPWIGHCREEYEEMINPYSHWEEQADYEEDESDRKREEEQIERLRGNES